MIIYFLLLLVFKNEFISFVYLIFLEWSKAATLDLPKPKKLWAYAIAGELIFVFFFKENS